MNIVHVPRRFVRSHWGGTETVILQTCKQLQRMGHRSEILSSLVFSREWRDEIEGVPIRRVPYFYPYWGLRQGARRELDFKGGNAFSFHLMRALTRYRDLDLIHLHTGKRLGGIARFVARRRGIPYVISLHGGAFDVPPEEARTWTEPARGAIEWGKILGWWVGSRRVLDDAAAILCVGQREQEKTQERYPRKRVLHLPNAVDVDHFCRGDGSRFRKAHGIPERAFVIINVGRIDSQKNQMFLVENLPEMIRRQPGTHLVLVGAIDNEAYARDLQRTIREKELQESVTIIPGLPATGEDLVDAYHGADLFCLPSRHEPFGIVILEAWAAGLPVIANRVGGVPSFVRDGENGLLVEVGDAAGVVDAVASLARQFRRRRKIAEAGHRDAREKFGWAAQVGRLVEIYEEVRRS